MTHQQVFSILLALLFVGIAIVIWNRK